MKSEVDSLIVEKEAFRKLSKKEFWTFKEAAKAQGKKVEELPSKIVWTLKPDPTQLTTGKRKVRWATFRSLRRMWTPIVVVLTARH